MPRGFREPTFDIYLLAYALIALSRWSGSDLTLNIDAGLLISALIFDCTQATVNNGHLFSYTIKNQLLAICF